MTQDTRATARAEDTPASARTVGAPPSASRRRAIAWIAIAGFAVLVGITGTLLSGIGTWTERDRLDPDSAGPQGTAALVAILRDQGIEVVVTRDSADALRLLEDSAATLVTSDSPLLGDDTLGDLFDAATDVVLIDPRARGVDLLFPGATAGGIAPADAVTPDCDVDAAVRAGSIVPGRILVPATSDTSACYPAADGYGLLTNVHGEGRATAFDGRELITNETLATNGNAALALNLMGRLPTVVWFVPSLDDSALSDGDAAAEPTLGELTPGWVTPAIVLLGASAVVAAIWRGRRFGPLVVERLPVTARATETMQGRGRLYERGRDTVHAADSLRLGSLERLRRALALPPAASAAQIADAAADLSGIGRADARHLLFEAEPRTERDLLRLSDGMRTLEDAVARGVRGEAPTSTPAPTSSPTNHTHRPRENE